ncbi:MAG: ABC transporter permease [Spirochaetota bacterium]
MSRRFASSPAIGFIAVLLAWGIASAFLPSRLVPDPITVTVRMVELIGATLPAHLGASILRLLAAVSGAFLIGVPLGLLMGMHPRVNRVLGPVAYVLYPVPKIALLPVFMLLLGIGNVAKVTLVVTIIVFQLLLAARDGAREIPRAVLISARSLNVRGWELYRHVVVPATMPRIFTALRLSVGISFSVIFFSESFATRFGIGFFIMNAWAQVLYVDMFAGILALSIAGYLVFRAIDLIERAACPWLSA